MLRIWKPAVVVVLIAALPTLAAAKKATTQPAKAAIPQIAVFHLSDEILERPLGVNLGFNLEPAETLYDLVHRLALARKDPSVKAVVLTFEEPIMGWAQMQELRSALVELRKSGKDVQCYLEEVSGGMYQLASAATRVCIAPGGQIDLTGLHVEAPYFKGLLDKIRLEADIEHIGAYKGAGEPFTRTGPSDEARQMLEWIVKDLFEQMVDAIAQGRQMTPQHVRELIDQGPFNAHQAQEAQLVDESLDADEFLDALYDRYGAEAEVVRDYGEETEPEVDLSSPFAFFKLLGESMGKKKGKVKSEVAVVHVDGLIVTGSNEPDLFGDSGETGSTTIRRMLARLREDDAVKAVVVRVDSPGGSALASDIMWRAVRDLADEKPTAVSMGNLAASGGYYLSVGAPTIFADPGTITGSIGVIGGKLVTKGLWDWLGVSFHELALGKNADLYNSNRRFDDRQREIIRGQLKYVYGLFIDRVTEGRQGKLAKDLEELAGGRVFTGKQARANGLVDQLGGLQDAIAFVANQAKVKDYEVRQFPEPRNLFDLIIEGLTGQGGKEDEGGGVSLRSASRKGMHGRVGEARWLFSQPAVRDFIETIRQADPARTPWVVRGLRRLDLIRRYQSLMVMPDEVFIR